MQRKRLSLLWIMLMLCVLLSFVAEANTKKTEYKGIKICLQEIYFKKHQFTK
jgi:hypothetical protein